MRMITTEVVRRSSLGTMTCRMCGRVIHEGEYYEIEFIDGTPYQSYGTCHSVDARKKSEGKA